MLGKRNIQTLVLTVMMGALYALPSDGDVLIIEYDRSCSAPRICVRTYAECESQSENKTKSCFHSCNYILRYWIRPGVILVKRSFGTFLPKSSTEKIKNEQSDPTAAKEKTTMKPSQEEGRLPDTPVTHAQSAETAHDKVADKEEVVQQYFPYLLSGIFTGCGLMLGGVYILYRRYMPGSLFPKGWLDKTFRRVGYPKSSAGADSRSTEGGKTPETETTITEKSTEKRPVEKVIGEPLEKSGGAREAKPQAPTLSWDEFKKENLESVLGKPMPSFSLAPLRGDQTMINGTSFRPSPTMAELNDLLAMPENQAWIRDCRSFENQLETAAHFLKWAKKQPDGTSLLLTARAQICYWFVGDIHGDFESLSRIYAYIRQDMQQDQEHNRHVLILLGDLIDRGEEELAVLALVQKLLMKQNEADSRLSLIVLRGNHDCALNYDKEKDLYRSRVSPAETSELLNQLVSRGLREEANILGTAIMELGRISPCMGELARIIPARPEATILFTHGGVPHTDLQKAAYESFCKDASPHTVGYHGGLIDSLPASFRGAWMSDFTWVRLVEKGPFKRPNRGAMGCQMGTQDVNCYRRLHYLLTGRAITFIIRGHDHEEGGYKLYSYDPIFNPSRGSNEFSRPQENCGVLTINAMDRGGEDEGEAVAARWCMGEAIALYRFPFVRS